MKDRVEYDQFCDALHRANAGIEGAEAHGVLCGLLCAQSEDAEARWLQHCLAQAESGDLLAAETQALLKELYQQTREQLDGGEFDFQLLLPAEKAGLYARVEALGYWCQGFLLGISLAGVVNTTQLPGELPDFIKDLLEISRAENFALENENEDEAAYMELVEYVRMGVLLFHEELRALKQGGDNKVLH